jgi:hypothetical protein
MLEDWVSGWIGREGCMEMRMRMKKWRRRLELVKDFAQDIPIAR